MSYKFDSMLRILNKINCGETVTRAHLAKELQVTVRTADRYISTLRKADFPVSFNEERGSYVFEEGFSLSKTEFTPEEALAMGLARTMASKFGPKTDKVLKGIEHKMSVCSMSLPKHIVFSDQEMPPLVEENFRKLNSAIINLNQVDITYASAYRGEDTTCRTIDPHYLVFKDGIWYVRAYCRLKKEPRLFALDRIEDLTVTTHSFLPKPEINPSEMKYAFGSIVDGDPVDVVLRFDPICKPYLKRMQFPSNQPIKKLSDGKLELNIKTHGTKGIKLFLYRFLPNVEVVEPMELKTEIKNELKEAMNRI